MVLRTDDARNQFVFWLFWAYASSVCDWIDREYSRNELCVVTSVGKTDTKLSIMTNIQMSMNNFIQIKQNISFCYRRHFGIIDCAIIQTDFLGKSILSPVTSIQLLNIGIWHFTLVYAYSKCCLIAFMWWNWGWIGRMSSKFLNYHSSYLKHLRTFIHKQSKAFNNQIHIWNKWEMEEKEREK